MNKKVPGSILVIISLGIFFIVSTSLPAQAAVSKISAQYLVFPTTVYVESTITMTICLVNEGETGQLIYDGGANTDHVAISIPIGSNFDELAEPPILISCTTSNPSWICEEPIITGTEILLTMHPNGTVWVQEGEMICFNINPVQVNSQSGLAFLNVDQHFNTKRADRLRNGNLGVFKTEETTSPPYTEIDPTVNALGKATLSCIDGQVAKWNVITSAWECANDTDTDTKLTETEVDSFVANNGYLTSFNETDPSVNALGKATLSCADGQIAKWNSITSAWECADDVDTDTDTKLSQAEVNAYETDPTVNALGKAALTCADGQIPKWNATLSAWECANDIDTDTKLTETEVDSFVANNGYLTSYTESDPTVNALGKAALSCADGQVAKWNEATSAWECANDTDTDTKLSQAEVNNYESDPTVNTLAKANLSCADGQVAKWNSTTSAWECANDTDTGLTEETDPTVNTLAKAALSCADGQVAKWNSTTLAWECANDTDTDTKLSQAEVNAYETDPKVNALGKATLSCANGQVAKWNESALSWECANDTDTDTDTKLSQAEVNAYETDPKVNALGKAALTCADGQVAKWNETDAKWECSDDTDTDTKLTETEVDAFVGNNGYLTSYTETDPLVNALGKASLTCSDGQIAKWNSTTSIWECADDVDTDTDTDTKLTEAEVDGFVANNGYLTSYTESDPTVNALGKATLTCTDGQVAKLNSTTSSWECANDIDTDTDTKLSQSEVNAYETDPKITSTITNQIPKWDGSRLVDSSSLFEDASGNVGVGRIPERKMDVAGIIRATNNTGPGPGEYPTFEGYIPGESQPRIRLTDSAIQFGPGGVIEPDMVLSRTGNIPYPSMRVRAAGNSSYEATLFALDAPFHNPKEATLSLVRNPEPNQEIVDIYNMNYPDAEQFGIRFIKSNAADPDTALRPFVIEFQEGTGGTITEGLRILPDGKIGIGTKTPIEKLHLVGNLKVEGIITGNINGDADTVDGKNAADFLWGENNLSDVLDLATARTNLGLGDAATKNVGTNPGEVAAGEHTHDALYFKATDSASFAGLSVDTDTLTVDAVNDRVGIGTTSPSERLEVAGAVKATAFMGDGSGLTGINGGDASYGSSASSPDDAVYVDDSGNVGIGTTGPSESLEVAGVIKSISGGFKFPDGTVQTTAALGGGGIGGSGADNYIPRWNGTGALENSAIYQSDTGNVGIGTTSPGTKLYVLDTSTYLQGIFDGGSGGGSAVAGGISLRATRQYELQSTGSGVGVNPNGFIVYDRTGSAYRLLLDSSGNFGIGGSITDSSFSGATMVLKSGNVGIGTANPDVGAKLHLSTTDDTASAIYISNTAGVRRFAINPRSFGGWTMYDYASGSWTEGISQRSGNVGIGTTSPGAKLEVAGAVKMAGFNLPTGAASGYVLTSDASGAGTWQAVAGGADTDWTEAGGNVYRELGNVGIGTTSPVVPLQIKGNTLNALSVGPLNPNVDADGRISASGSAAELSLTDRTSSYFDNRWVIYPKSDGTLSFWRQNHNTPLGPDQLSITSSGNVGIGTTSPNRKLKVNGDAGGTTAWYNDSDERLKTNIQTIENGLEKVKALRGVQYEWIDQENHPKGKQIGFIGQEAGDVIPEVVDEKDGYYSMQYAPITAVLVEAVKEQQSQVEELRAQNEALVARNEAQETLIEKQQSQIEDLIARISALEAAK